MTTDAMTPEQMDVMQSPRIAVLVSSGIVLLTLLILALPIGVNHQDEWIDQLKGAVLLQQSFTRTGSSYPSEPSGTFDPYLGQLVLVRHFYRAGDQHGTYVAMNRFMDMLEAREGGISDRAADAIWDLCYEVTPGKYHDQSRHVKKARHQVSPDEWANRMKDASPPIW